MLRSADRVAVLTGAGISAESGVPTFRDAQTGLWARYRAEDLATPEAFAADPGLVWAWYARRRALVAQAEPNAGHRALAEMAQHLAHFTLITQNVDGLHRRAGSSEVLELHGNIERTMCSRERRPVASWDEDGATPPRCPRCGAPLRPDVVWFGEPLPEPELRRAFEATAECQLFLCVGTSTVVHPAASLPFEALAHGAAVVEINPTPTPLTPRAAHVLAAPAAQVLPALCRAAWRGEAADG